MRKIHFNQEHAIGIICLIIAGFTRRLTSEFPEGMGSKGAPGPDFFPNVLTLLLIVFGVMEIVIGFKKQEQFDAITLGKMLNGIKSWGGLNILLVIALMLFYINFFEILGFIITSFIVLFILMWRLKVPWWKNIIATATLIIVIQLLFGYLFTISLPYGVLSGIL
ncbi:MAG: tripartite tricarboxylate transporter TctB family protein [Spirochaetaceae bacterium]|nr:tripartite tricarboxylate transporter TctB family protein [Spirochaetaceae bacterium]MCF7950315.1 tripartite tricarboxylate transporter TctB family protein [Spirochaetaceae bacterium]